MTYMLPRIILKKLLSPARSIQKVYNLKRKRFELDGFVNIINGD